MRWVLACVLLLPLASAQVITDPQGDVQISVADQDVAAIPQGAKDSVDLTAITIEEDGQEFLFHIDLVEAMAAGDDSYSDREIVVYFTYGGNNYAIQWSMLLQGEEQARLLKEDTSRGWYRSEGTLVTSMDPAAERITVVTPFDMISDTDGAPPLRDRSLTKIWAMAQAPVLASNIVSIYPSLVTGDPTLVILEDTAARDEPASYVITTGPEVRGSAEVTSKQTHRMSNGEAGTFVYWVNATRLEAGSGRYTLETRGVPPGWAVEHTRSLELTRGQSLRLPVVLQTAFAHSHGEVETFDLVLKEDGKVSSTLTLGINYPLIPQPAGHHNVLSLWSRTGGNIFSSTVAPAHQAAFGNGGDEVAYMNAAEENPDDLGQKVDFDRCGGSIGAPEYCMHIFLEPGLGMGLDFRTEEKGRLQIQVDSPVPATGVRVTGDLVHYVAERVEMFPGFTVIDHVPKTIATLQAPDPFDLGLGETKALDIVVTPLARADLIPYHKDAGMYLRLNLTIEDVRPNIFFGAVGDVQPRLLPGGTMELPLDEYKDPVDHLPSFGNGLEWKIDHVERRANPGGVLVYRASLANTGATDTFTINLIGQNQEWAELIGKSKVKIPGNGTARYDVVVRVPTDAAHQSSAELVLEAASVTDLSRRSLVQFRSMVVTDVEVPDDAEILDGLGTSDQKSPGAPALVPLLLIGAVLHRARRSTSVK